MSENSKIEWTDHSWNPVTGCTKVSTGCDNCYAETMAERFRGQPAFPNGFDLTLRRNKLHWPITLKPQDPQARIFVNSMSDLFHKDIPLDYLQGIFDVMKVCPQHIFQVLTKRPHMATHRLKQMGIDQLPENVWLGVSVENQTFAKHRIPELLKIQGDVRWLSCEPLLGPVDLTAWLPELQWVVVGGESGGGRRPMDYDWARGIRDQCEAAGVPLFYKQGNGHRPGTDRELDGQVHNGMPDSVI